MCCQVLDIAFPANTPTELLNFAGRYHPQENETTANGTITF